MAVVELRDGSTVVLERRIESPAIVPAIATELAQRFDVTQLLVGDSTTSQSMADTLRQALPGVNLELVDEKGSTLAARALYWEANPPRGWRRALPLSLLEPPEPVDDFAAVVLARRFFGVE